MKLAIKLPKVPEDTEEQKLITVITNLIILDNTNNNAAKLISKIRKKSVKKLTEICAKNECFFFKGKQKKVPKIRNQKQHFNGNATFLGPKSLY